MPLVPSWALAYGALYLFLILLPVFIVRRDELIRRTVYAYLLVWITAYIFFFVVYPTAAPRPSLVSGEGFAVWGLRALYSSDPRTTASRRFMSRIRSCPHWRVRVCTAGLGSSP